MKRVAFDLNDYVIVKPLPCGMAIVNKEGLRIDVATGECRLQLWRVIEAFGPATHLGFPSPIDTTIYFEVDEKSGEEQ